MKIYTKTGDKGETSLYGGKRILKNDTRIEAYGSVDELNSSIGTVISQTKDKNIINGLTETQKNLMEIGSTLAGYKTLNTKYLILNTKKLENWIDDMDSELPILKNFILPQGVKSASLLHLSRSICRRAERRVVELSQKEEIHQDIIAYLNRLSDLLFVLARYINRKNKIKEIVWKVL